MTRSFTTFLLLVTSVQVSPIGAAQVNRKLSPLARTGTVTAFRPSADGFHVLLEADTDADSGDSDRLYRVAVDGSLPPLALPQPTGVSFRLLPDVQESADGSLAIFRAELGGVGVLYNTHTSYGYVAPVLLSANASGTLSVNDFQLSADGARAVYRAGTNQGRFELYSVPLDGSSAPVQISAPSSEGSVTDSATGGDYLISPDGTRVVYRADKRIKNEFELFSVPIAGGTVVRLNDDLVANGDVRGGFQIGADGYVYYRADARFDQRVELFRAPVDGSAAPTRLGATLVPDGGVQEFRLSADGTRIVYRADQDADEVFDLYSVPADGSSAPVKLNVSAPFADVQPDFEIAADNLGVAYRADQDRDEVVELYSVSILGGTPLRRSGPMIRGGDVRAFHISTATLRLVFLADRRVDGIDELYSTSISSGPPVLLHDELAPGRGVTDFALSPDGTSVVFRADLAAHGEYALHVAPADASAPARPLHSIHVPGGRVEDFAFSAGGSRVVYRASQESLATELFSVPLDASTAPVRINEALPAGAPDSSVEMFQVAPHGDRAAFLHGDQLYSVSGTGRELVPLLTSYQSMNNDVLPDFAFTPDASHLLFTLDREDFGGTALYSVPSDGTRPPARLGPSGNFITFHISPDGGRVAFTADGEALFLAPVDAADDDRETIVLNDPLPHGDSILSFEFSPDGSRVVYAAGNHQTCYGCAVNLYSVPSDRSQAPLLLFDFNPSDVFHVSPDGARVVYEAGDLYSVPIDGSSSPVQLNGAFVQGGGVWNFEISPDATRVAYAADANVQGVRELFSVPIDGSSAAVLVSSAAVPSSIVPEYRFTPDSTRIVARMTDAAADRPGLYSVRSDGSAPRIALNLPLGQNQGVKSPDGGPSFSISPDSKRVVYHADQFVDERYELLSVPVDRSFEPVRLNTSLHANADVQGWAQISPDGRCVAYRADQDQVGQIELFAVRIEGGATPLQLNAPLVPGGDVQGLSSIYFQFNPYFRFSADSWRVIYLADQEFNGITELFSTELPHTRPSDGTNLPLKLR